MSAVMYHPQTQATIVVSPDAVPQYRQSGWLLRSEWEANQATTADTAAADPAAEADAEPAAEAEAAQITENEEN
jgi:hypothetical protein